jgi:hypothetical protein
MGRCSCGEDTGWGGGKQCGACRQKEIDKIRLTKPLYQRRVHVFVQYTERFFFFSRAYQDIVEAVVIEEYGNIVKVRVDFSGINEDVHNFLVKKENIQEVFDEEAQEFKAYLHP